jgi:hypothetical protein
VRSGWIFLLAVLLGAVLATSLTAGAATIDKGSDSPPGKLSSDAKAIWMTEWVACWRVSMSDLSKVLRVPVRSGATPQQAAKKLAHRAVFLLYETEPELVVGADGCRNGILWNYYHPNTP